MKLFTAWALALLGTLLGAPASPAGTAADGDAAAQGLAIAEEAERRDTGWGDLQVAMTMVLRNRRGEESVRELRLRSAEVAGDGERSLIIFDAPRDQRGTALLTWSHLAEADDQWLYLPVLKRRKRIASSNRSGPFVGSEFAFEDLTGQEPAKYTWRLLGEVACGPLTCFELERRPKDPDSGYTRQVVHLDTGEYRIQRIDYFDRRDSLLKTLTVSGYAQYDDAWWRPARMAMVNHQTGKETDLVWRDWRFGTGLDAERDFNPNSLARVR